MNKVLKKYFLLLLNIILFNAHSQSNNETIDVSSYIRGAGSVACYNDERRISIEQYIIQPLDVYYKVTNLSTCNPALAYAIDYEENNNSLKWSGSGITSNNLNSATVKLTENNTIINIEWKTIYHYPSNQCLAAKTITKSFQGESQPIIVRPLSQKPQVQTFTAISPINNQETVGIKVSGCASDEIMSWEPSIAGGVQEGVFYLTTPMICQELKVKCKQLSCNYEDKWSDPIRYVATA